MMRRVMRAAVLVVAVLVGTSAQAADNSLQLVPANAGFYSALLHNKAQLDLFTKSKAFQTLWNLPQVQLGWKALQAEYAKDKSELAKVRQVLESPLGKDGLAVLSDAVSEEIFLYGGESWGGLLKLGFAVMSGVQYGPARALLEGKGGGLNPNELQGYAALKALATNLDLVQVPDLVLGFKLKDTEKAETLLKKIEVAVIVEALKGAPRPIQDVYKRTQVGKSSLLTFTVSGAMLPWDRIPIKDLEQKDGEFGPLVKKLQQMQFTLSLGVHEGFLVVGIGPSAQTVGKLSTKGPLLKDSAEFKLLAKAGSNRITDINYSAKSLLAPLYAANAESLDSLLELGTAALNASPLPEERKAKIQKDLEAFVKDAKSVQVEAGAALSFNFTTTRGTEGYAYDWTKNPYVDGSKPLPLFQHAGGTPILVNVARSKVNVAMYQGLAKYARIAYGHIDAYAQDNLPNEEAKKRYLDITQALAGIMKKFDAITVDLFYPATADGQFGFVIDGKWTSNEWITGVKLPRPMPMLEVGMVLGLADAQKFTQAITAYRKLINEAINEFGRVVPDATLPPALEIPPPKSKMVEGGTLYHYPLEGVPLDKQFQPLFGVGKDVLVFACGEDHVKRLLAKKPLKLTDGPLGTRLDKPLVSGFYLDFPAFIDGLAPWVEVGVGEAVKEAIKDKDQAADAMKAVTTLIRVLKCVKATSSATYLEGGATVTHSETVVKDLE